MRVLRPIPTPPYLPIYPIEDHARLQSDYEEDRRLFDRECERALLADVVIVLCSVIGLIMLAIVGPDIAINMIYVLSTIP